MKKIKTTKGKIISMRIRESRYYRIKKKASAMGISITDYLLAGARLIEDLSPQFVYKKNEKRKK